ncbi:MAG TPA: DUF2946 family protein [Rhizomicrobium sp.]|jgi:hypothetical protein
MQGAKAPVIRSADSALSKWRKSGGFNFFLLLAFFFQSFIAQTHIHGVPQGSPYTVSAAAGATSSPMHHVPSKDKGEANCPFCQAVLHAGAFFAPHALLILPPSQTFASAAPFSYAVGTVSEIGHDWQQRAPPLI